MSLAATSFVYDLRVPNPRAKLILIAMSDYADEDFRVLPLPTSEYLEAFSDSTPEQVQAALGWLRKRGFLIMGEGAGYNRKIVPCAHIRAPQPKQCRETPECRAAGGLQ